MSATIAPLRNAELGELLCRAAENDAYSQQQRRALRRAGRAAFRWPAEVRDLAAHADSLTELRFVGPWIARLLHEWLHTPAAAAEPPPTRRGFLTHTEAQAILAATSPALRVRGDLQVHTLGSDGTASAEAMARAAAEHGLAYLAVTDHSKGLAIANGMNEEQLARQAEEIERAQETVTISHPGFRVLRAVEMNLSPAGVGDLDPGFLATLDLVLGAFHSRLRVPDDQTERYLAAVGNPSIHVLAHPRGRIFNFRLGLTADWARVFEAARAHECAVEIDAYPDRQDLDGDLLALARETGVRISIGSDAHAPYQIGFLDYGVAAARRARIPEDRILNCLSAEDLLAWSAAKRGSALKSSAGRSRARSDGTARRRRRTR